MLSPIGLSNRKPPLLSISESGGSMSLMGLMALVGGMNFAAAENYLPAFHLDGFVGIE